MFAGWARSSRSRERSLLVLHATMPHLLGMDARRLTYNRHGLDERLTDQYPARVAKEILA